MFQKLLDFFKPKPRAPLTVEIDSSGVPVHDDVLIAILVLLAEASGRDGHIAPEEAQSIVEIMMMHFGVPQDTVVSLLSRALEERGQEKKLDRFVNLLNDTYNDKQRQLLLAMIWRIVSADGEVEGYERRFATQMKFRFRLNEAMETEARRMVNEGLV